MGPTGTHQRQRLLPGMPGRTSTSWYGVASRDDRAQQAVPRSAIDRRGRRPLPIREIRIAEGRQAGAVALGEDTPELGLGMVHTTGHDQRCFAQVDKDDLTAGLEPPTVPKHRRQACLASMGDPRVHDWYGHRVALCPAADYKATVGAPSTERSRSTSGSPQPFRLPSRSADGPAGQPTTQPLSRWPVPTGRPARADGGRRSPTLGWPIRRGSRDGDCGCP